MSQSTVKKIPNNYFDGMPVTGFHKIVFFIIMMAYFCEQMDNWNFGFIAPALMHTWGLQMSDIGVVTLWYFIGMTAGGFFGGVISDFIGRRKTFLISIATFSFFSVLNGFTDNFHVFVIARSMTGFGVFCLMVCSQAYIAEMAPAESRGKWQNLVAAVGFSAVPVIGVMCRAIIPLAEEAWRFIFYFGGVGLIAFFVGLRYLKESPRWLVARGRLEEAEQVVFEITGKHVDLSEAAKNVQTKVPVMEVLTGMFRRQYIKRTLVLLAIVVFTNPATFTVTNWTATLLKAHGFSLEDSLMATTIISVGVPAGLFFSSFVTDLGGRKIPIMCMLIILAVLGPIFGNMTGYWPVVLTGVVLTAVVMAMGFTVFSYTAESYPTRMRNTAPGFHSSTSRWPTLRTASTACSGSSASSALSPPWSSPSGASAPAASRLKKSPSWIQGGGHFSEGAFPFPRSPSSLLQCRTMGSPPTGTDRREKRFRGNIRQTFFHVWKERNQSGGHHGSPDYLSYRRHRI